MQLRFLLDHAAPYRGRLILISLLTILGSASMLAMPWLAGQLIGGVVDDDTGNLYPVIGMLVLALLTTTIFRISASIVSSAASMQILADLRLEIYVHIQRLTMGFHDRSRQGDLLALMTYEVANLSSFLTATLATTPSMLLTATGAVILLFLIDPVLALFIPVLIPGVYLILKLVGRRLRSIARKERESEAMVMAIAESHLEMLPATKAFAVEGQQTASYFKQVEKSRKLAYAHARIYAFLAPFIAFVAAIAAILVIVIAGSQLGSGEKTTAEVFSFLLYAALLTQPVGALADVYGRYQSARGTLSRLQVVLGSKVEPGLDAAGQTGQVRGDIEFSDIRFAYPGRQNTLRGASLSVHSGETIALTGENGAGKSTLMSLLLRFYDPDSGKIAVDGQDIAGFQVQELRRQIGFVPQRPLLFNGTIRDNIAFGLPGASDVQIGVAAKLSQAHEFIASLPKGLKTEIGDNGVRLSGGQRQRIALARALLADPPILILDEATSMYDLEGEAAFIEACQDALAGRTVIIITHRQASLALADRVVCVQDGVIREVPGI